MKRKSAVFYIVSALILYAASTGVSFGAFKMLGVSNGASLSPVPSPGSGKFIIDSSLPKTEVCPLNGQKFTKQERDIWEKRRPLAVMIENHEEARPQSGLSYADIVYETVAEGGITRFMGVFYCGIAGYSDVSFAPVRSARTYYVDWVSEYDALYNHVGGAGKCNDDGVDERAKALCQINRYGIKDMDQFALPLKTKDNKDFVCVRDDNRLDHEVATEHTMVCHANGLLRIAKEEREWTNVDEEGVSWDKNFKPWKFKDEAKETERGTVATLSFAHWESYAQNYGVQWNYDASSNSYKRLTGGQSHVDLETKEQLSAKNIVVQFAKETVGVDDHGHLLYGTIGEGKALIFQDGKVIKGSWEKTSRTARTIFSDDKGKEIEFSRGPIWIEVVSLDTDVQY